MQPSESLQRACALPLQPAPWLHLQPKKHVAQGSCCPEGVDATRQRTRFSLITLKDMKPGYATAPTMEPLCITNPVLLVVIGVAPMVRIPFVRQVWC